MQYVGENETNVVAGNYLALYDRIVSVHGPSIIINAISRNDTIMNRVSNYH